MRMWRWLGPLVALMVLVGVFSLLRPASFPTAYNVEVIARQTTVVAMAALGATLIILAGGIDLSVGSLIAMTTVMVAWLMASMGVTPLGAVGLAVMAATLLGLVNGLLVTQLGVVPFIVTLGTMQVIRGGAKGLAGEQKIDAPITWVEGLLGSLPPGWGWMLLPPGAWLFVLLAAVTAMMLRFTRLGRHIVAVGSNEAAARLCGVPVTRVKLIVYALGGLFAGLAGVMLFSRLTVGDPTAAVGLELEVIAAVVIGGGSLAGGRGSIIGAAVGALIITTIANGCTQLGVPNWIQELLTGCIIVAAVALDHLRGSRTLR